MPEDKKKLPGRSKVDANAFEREVTTDLDEETPDKPKGLALHTRILIGLAVGVIAGVTVNYAFGGDHPRVAWVVDNITGPMGQLFLRLLLMIVVPLVFSSLVVGVAGIGDIRKLGRVGLKSFVYCFVLSAISVVIGLTLANTIKPGTRIDPDQNGARTALQLRCDEASGCGEEVGHYSVAAHASCRDPRALKSHCSRRWSTLKPQHSYVRRDAEHASPHVLRSGYRHCDHSYSSHSHCALAARTPGSV